MDVSTYCKIIELSRKYYSPKKMEHAKRVEKYTIEDTRYALLDTDKKYDIRAVALMHDLIEDTECPKEELNGIHPNIIKSVELLTHDKNISYYDYVKNIVDSNDIYAIIVKTADMKDHLTLKKTLTEKLKNKYEPVIPLLLR